MEYKENINSLVKIQPFRSWEAERGRAADGRTCSGLTYLSHKTRSLKQEILSKINKTKRNRGYMKMCDVTKVQISQTEY